MDLKTMRKNCFIYLPFIVVFFVLTVWTIGSLCFEKEYNMKIPKESPVVLEDEWFYSDTKEVITKNKIQIKKGELLKISRILPEKIDENTSISFWNFYTDFDIFINNENIKSGGSEKEIKFGKEQGGLWYFFDLTPEMANQEIRFELKSTNGNQNFFLSSVNFGNKNTIKLKILKKNYPIIIIACVLLVLIILLIMYSQVLVFYKITEYSNMLWGLVGLSLVSVSYIFFESNCCQFVLENPSVKYIGSYMSVFLIPVFGCIFFKEFFDSGKNAFIRIGNIYGILVIVDLILYILNVMHLLTSVFLVYVNVFALTIAVTIFGIKDFKKTKSFLPIWIIIALLILVGGTIVSVSLFYVGYTFDNIIPYSITYSLFLSILFITVMRKTFNTFSKIKVSDYYRELALIDPVTGGNTRFCFDEIIKDKKVNNSYFLLVNLVHFKLINQILGRDRSDILLRGVYEELETLLSEDDYLCALGDARFGLWLNKMDEKRIYELCIKIKDKIANYCTTHNYSIKIVEQFAACKIENKKNKVDELIDHSVIALTSKYAQFLPDANCYLYNEVCNSKLLQEKMLSDYFETALANNEFHVYLQPKVSLADGKVHSAEALVRWISPEKGIIPPDEFISSFEQDGKIEKLDLHLFKLVCIQINQWLERGIEPPIISVNISKVAINYEGYFNKYLEIIDENNIPGKYLEFELTESIAYNNIKLLRDIIDKIHDIGACCAMDDFGKSYSNIGALGLLPFDTAKMDKCFFDDGFPEDIKRTQLVRGTVELLKNLDLEIVAEGVEERNQVEALKKLQCDCIQGYYYAKPMDMKTFMKYVTEKNGE